MRRLRNGVVGLVAALWCGAAGAQDASVIWAGRCVEPGRDAHINVEAGAIVKMDGYVQETTRALYDVTDHQYKNDSASTFDLNDFDIDGGYAVIGLSFEKAWKYITLNGQVLGMNPATDSTARRNYYIDVGNVSINGQNYDKLKIPEGTPFSAEMQAAIIELQFLVTPVTFWLNENTRFSPWVGLGVFGLVGSYDVDAGPATGVTQYQNPPEDFVVGGHADGDLAGGLPEILVGGELVFGALNATHIVLQGTYGFLDYNGNSSLFTTSDQVYDKNADITLAHVQARAAVEIPLHAGPVLSFGAQYQTIDTEGTLSQTGKTDAEILARQERFDKNLDFSVSLATAFVGLAF